MKKLVFMFVACATMSLAVSFSSCGNGAGADTAKADTNAVDTNAVDTNAVDTNAVDTNATDTVKA